DVVLAAAAHGERVAPVTVPVAHEHVVARAPVAHDPVGRPSGDGVPEVVLLAPPYGGGAGAVTGPVRDEAGGRRRPGPAARGLLPGVGVVEEVGVAAAHGQGVRAVAVPVPDEHLVGGQPEGEAEVGGPSGEAVAQVVVVAVDQRRHALVQLGDAGVDVVARTGR